MEKSSEITLKFNKRKFDTVQITSSTDLYNYSLNLYGDDINIFESVFVVFVNNANKVVAFYKVSSGGITSSIIDVKIICKCAIDCLCTGVFLVHNHPSGNIAPSQSDVNISSKLKECLNFFDIKLLDSIVISDEGYYSFADRCLL